MQGLAFKDLRSHKWALAQTLKYRGHLLSLKQEHSLGYRFLEKEPLKSEASKVTP